MNERIKELIPQLGEPSTWGCERPVGPGFAGSRWSGWADHKDPYSGFGPKGYTTPLYDEAQLEKFAELIVKECIDVATKDWYTPDGYGTVSGQTKAVQFIKEHFGIKE